MGEHFCPHCMQPVRDGEEYCGQCGQEISIRSESYQLPIGSVLQGDKNHSYQFGKAIGGGGFGQTYIAKQLDQDRLVAIKEYFPMRCQPQRHSDGSVSPTVQMEEIYRQGMKSFLSEATMLEAVNDIPSVVHVLDYFEGNGSAYMVMEYLDGNTLSSLMKTQNRFEPTLLLQKMLKLMQDIELLHKAGVLHRDIAPDNIMLMPDGTLKLLDFGCARSMEDGKSMEVLLKPGFAPIEQYQTRGQGAYTDIYALCATIYYCLTGQVPVDAIQRLSAVSEGKPDPLVMPEDMGISIPAEVQQMLRWGLELQPRDRPQSMTELAAMLVPHPHPGPGPSPEPHKFGDFIRQNIASIVIAAVIVTAVLIMILR